jgi:aryl-alcohol dehydrogenase-like predicted oxidoreductase
MEWLKEGLLTEQNLTRVRAFGAKADEIGASRSQLALAWAASHKAVSSVILGATRLEQLQENLGALRVNMTTSLRAELDQMFPI